MLEKHFFIKGAFLFGVIRMHAKPNRSAAA